MTRNTLIADIGGTNTRVALASDGTLRDDTIRRYRNAENAGLDAVLARYRAEVPVGALDGVCVDIAGPVHDGHGTLTNLDWTLDEDRLRDWTGAPHAALINDLQAQGHGAADLPTQSLRCIVEGKAAREQATRLVVNVGTGFNAAVVFDGPQGRSVPPAEAGHAGMPVRSDADLRLARFVEGAHGFASVEDVLSGRGLERTHLWLTTESGTAEALSAAQIIGAARSDPDTSAAASTAVFARLLGAVTGDLALVHLPFGGIYLVGGVVVALAERLHALGFTDALRDKGRFSALVAGFPVYVVEDDYAALRGAARHLEARLQQA